MENNSSKPNFWTTLPGIFTGIAALLTAIAGLIIALNQLGGSPPEQEPDPGSELVPESTPVKPSETVESNVLFTDSFETSQINPQTWQIYSGSWYIDDGELHGIGKTVPPDVEWAAITLNLGIPDEVAVSFKMKIIDGFLGELLFHLANNRYVRVYLNNIEQTLILGDGIFAENTNIGNRIYTVSPGGGRTVREQSLPVKTGQWYLVSVKYMDNDYSVSVGGQTLITYSDPEKKLQSTGTIGLIANGHISFDDIVISKVR